ncbi:SLC4A5 isoform 5, partial [Pan troglodytes]
RIHLFTLVQILCLAVLWILKSTVAAIIFPVMPQFPPPSVIKIPMESVQSDPQNGIHCIARKRSSSWSYSL